jgi:hypothetical protein
METAERTFALGDLVTVKPDMFGSQVSTVQVFKITKVPHGAREVNYVADPHESGGRGVRGPAYAFEPYDPANPPKPVVGLPWEPPNLLDVGTIVRVKGARQIDPTVLYVVTGNSRDLKGNRLVKVGGDGGRYWKSIPTSRCEVIDPSRLYVAEV